MFLNISYSFSNRITFRDFFKPHWNFGIFITDPHLRRTHFQNMLTFNMFFQSAGYKYMLLMLLNFIQTLVLSGSYQSHSFTNDDIVFYGTSLNNLLLLHSILLSKSQFENAGTAQPSTLGIVSIHTSTTSFFLILYFEI